MIDVVLAQPEQRERALSVMFCHDPAEERTLRARQVFEAADRGELSLDGLLLAEESGRGVGALLYVLQADGTAFVWPPVVREETRFAEVSDALLQAAGRHLDRAGVTLGQCLLEPDRAAEREALERNGFEHFADLTFMQRPLDLELPRLPDAEFETVAFDPERNRQRFERVLELTYRRTLDCPKLSGTRTAAEALESHRTAGRFDPARWKLYRAEGVDVAVLLLNEHPDLKAWEVVYMGVIPQARGRGYGRALLLAGLHEARQGGAESMLLAVDNRNVPAQRIYAELGFVEVGLQSVHIRLRRGASGE